MVGCVLRCQFDMLDYSVKNAIKSLCEEYKVKPVCMYPGGCVESMSFDFGEDDVSKEQFVQQMESILNVKCNGNKRRVFGHRVACPL